MLPVILQLFPLELLLLLCRRFRMPPMNGQSSRPLDSPLLQVEEKATQGRRSATTDQELPDQPTQQQEQDAINGQHFGETEAAVSAGQRKGTSARSQRRAEKREKKLLKLQMKAQEEQRRNELLAMRQTFVEAPFNLQIAVAQGLVKPFLISGDFSEAEIPGTPAAVAAAARAAATSRQQAGDGGEEAIKGLFTGATPLLLITAKLRTVQAAEMLRPGEMEAPLNQERFRRSAASADKGPKTQKAEDVDDPEGISSSAKSAQLLQAAWDEEYGKEAQTIFAQIAYQEKTDTSVVLAMPVTGRSHQIRKHLKLLEHCIVGDSLYARQQDKQQQEAQQDAERARCAEEEGAQPSPNAARLRPPRLRKHGAHQPQEWWVRFSLEELHHLLPCSCNSKKAKKDSNDNSEERRCERDTAWHLQFLQQAIESAGGRATIPRSDGASIEVVYQLEVPDSICLFALFYAFPPESTQQEQEAASPTAAVAGAATGEAGTKGKRAFSSLLACPPWASDLLQRLRGPLDETLPKLAELKAHVLQYEPLACAGKLKKGNLEA